MKTLRAIFRGATWRDVADVLGLVMLWASCIFGIPLLYAAFGGQ